MKYVATLNGKKYEIEIERVDAYKPLDRGVTVSAPAPIIASAPAPAPVAAPVVEEEDGILVINPGSLTFPRQQGRRPSYAVMDVEEGKDLQVEIKYL